MEILGAVAASIQLAQLCYQSQQRLRQIPGDRQLVKVIKHECETLRTTIDDRRNDLTPEGYEASIHLAEGINDILKSIQKLERRIGIVKLVARLELQGPSLKERLDTVLLEYQSIVTISTDAAIKSIRDRLGPQGITADVEEMIEPVQSGIAKLKAQNGELRAVLRENQETTSEIMNELSAVIVNLPQDRANFVQENQEAAMDGQRDIMVALKELMRRSDGIDMSSIYEAILNIKQRMVQTPSCTRSTPLPRETSVTTILPNSTTNTPTILDYMVKLSAPRIDYVCSDPNTLGNYVREQRLRTPAEFMDEQEIWDIFRDIIVQVDRKCSAGNWSGEFSEGTPGLILETDRRHDCLRCHRGANNLESTNPCTHPLVDSLTLQDTDVAPAVAPLYSYHSAAFRLWRMLFYCINGCYRTSDWDWKDHVNPRLENTVIRRLNGLAMLAKHRVNALAVFLFMFWQTYAFGHLDILESQPEHFYALVIAWAPDLRVEGSGEVFYEMIRAISSKAEIDDVLDLYSVVDPWHDHNGEVSSTDLDVEG